MTSADLMPPESEWPTFASDWRMSREALGAIASLLCDRRPKSILETGPGLSSWLFFRYAEQTGAAYVIIDHEGEYHDRWRAWCAKCRFRDQCARARPLSEDGYYDLAGVAVPVCDFICLDGPIVSAARNGEAARCLLRAACDPDGAAIIVDDANRSGESALVAWLLESGFALTAEVADGTFPHRKTAILEGAFNRCLT